jgi:malonate-semialdehyde dehydrogenase (acetylating)/methylmalonate-semialdehyde dehydrogenase
MDAAAMTAPTATRLLDNYVAGAWTPAAADAEALDVTNPATGEVLARVPLSTAADLDAAVSAARAALPEWRAVSVIQRARKLFALREGLDARKEDLARSVTTEMGKTLVDARAEVARMIEMVEAACAIPTTMQGRVLEDVSRNVDAETVRQPVGVCAAIVPFNFPAMVPFWFLPFAIGCGNAFILKPSEQVPLTQQIAFEVLDGLGLPDGVVNLVNGGREVVEGILDHPGIDAVSFVGSAPVAKIVYERSAKAGKRVQALGGAKNHMVVMPDAVIDKTVDGIVGSAFGAAGQRCMAGSVVVTVGEAHERLLPPSRCTSATAPTSRRRSDRSFRARRATACAAGSTVASTRERASSSTGAIRTPIRTARSSARRSSTASSRRCRSRRRRSSARS